MDDFEMLFCECRSVVERFVRFKLPSVFDAEDVLQEVYIAATIRFSKPCTAWPRGFLLFFGANYPH